MLFNIDSKVKDDDVAVPVEPLCLAVLKPAPLVVAVNSCIIPNIANCDTQHDLAVLHRYDCYHRDRALSVYASTSALSSLKPTVAWRFIVTIVTTEAEL